jgi:hypothetical protein
MNNAFFVSHFNQSRLVADRQLAGKNAPCHYMLVTEIQGHNSRIHQTAIDCLMQNALKNLYMF